MALAHLDDPSRRNHALINGREIIYAAPTTTIEQRLVAAFEAAPSSMLHGLLSGDEAIELEWIVEQLQCMSEAPFAIVGELTGEDWDRVQTIELRTPTGRGENFEYDLLGTPCQNVVNQTACIYPNRVAELFPNDEVLIQMGVVSYIGLPLFGPGGRPLGIAVLLNQKPMSHADMHDTLSLLLAFRPRIEALLINRRSRRDMQLLSERLDGEDVDALGRLARTFARAMNVRCAFVARVADGAHQRMQTVTTAVDGALVEPVDYELCGTRLTDVEALGEIVLSRDLDDSWPKAAEIAGFPALGCLVLSLTQPDGRMGGQLGLIHDRPLNRRIGEQPVVRAFCQQIAFELHRHTLEAERQATERRMLELQRTEGLGILAGGIAHDFNNLLVGVLGNSEFVLSQFPDERDDDTRECLVDIRDAALAAMQLCRQMLAYAGRTSVESKRFDVAAELAELMRLLSASIPRSIQMAVEPCENACWIDGDVVQIRQMLMNLITNAGDAIGDRPGQIRISLDVTCSPQGKRHISGVTGTLTPGNYVCLSVQDDGCGMDEATRARIFDPFFTTKPSGHGLGLAAMLGIVRAHHGTLNVSSELGVGSRFVVYLPEAGVAA
jgi:two-component system, cell cycle sensor histidine kinase and response regulator CckA